MDIFHKKPVPPLPELVKPELKIPKRSCACGREAMAGDIQCWQCIHRA